MRGPARLPKPRKGGPPLGRPQPRGGGGAVSIEASFASAATEILGETAEVAEEMMAMQRPKRIRSAIALSILAFLNNFLIIVAAFVVVRAYLDINSDPFQPGLHVNGRLSPDDLDVTAMYERQELLVTSGGAAAAVSVRSATARSSALVLGKGSGSPDWRVTNNPQDKLVIGMTPKGVGASEQRFVTMDGAARTCAHLLAPPANSPVPLCLRVSLCALLPCLCCTACDGAGCVVCVCAVT